MSVNKARDSEGKIRASLEDRLPTLDVTCNDARNNALATKLDNILDDAPSDNQVGSPNSPKQKKDQRLLYVAITLFALAIIIAAALIYNYVDARKKNARIIEAAGLHAIDTKKLMTTEGVDELKIRWDALKEINPDIVGWVIIPDTRINYPIVQGTDNEHYLNHLVDGSYSSTGAIFLDCNNDKAIMGKNNVIYGHNLVDGSMFSALKQWREKDFFDANKMIILATPQANMQLEVLACLLCDANDEIIRLSFADESDYKTHVDILLGYAVHSEISAEDFPNQLYSFITCTDTGYSKRTVILARVIHKTTL